MSEKGIDLLVSFDTTGSMYPVLSRVRQEVASFVTDMFNTIEDLRVGVIAHGDYCDKDNPYTIRVMDMTTDKDKICEFIKTTDKTYGGDADECYELVLNTARTAMNWEAGRTKIFVVIGDASPHGVDYRDNKAKLDWKNEAGLLNDMGVQIYAVHALSYYRNSSKKFYETIAALTSGRYLTLDQFDEITDLIKATCISEYSEEKLNEFVSIIRSKGKMTKTMAANINRLTGKTLVADEGKRVQKDGLVPVTPGRFQIMTVDENCVIKDFVESNGIEFKKGRGFYELTKHETVQQYKEVIIQDKVTGEMFNGAQVRERLGLQPQIDKGGVKESLSSRDTKDFRVFVQSTSYNRKLIGGTTFLYEVSDLADEGTVIKEEPKKAVKEVAKTTKKAAKVEEKATKKAAKVEAKAEKEAVKAEKKAKKTTKKAAKPAEVKVEAPEIKIEGPSKEKLETVKKKATKKAAAKIEEIKAEIKAETKEEAKATEVVFDELKGMDTETVYMPPLVEEVAEVTDKTAIIEKRKPTIKTVNKHSKAVRDGFQTLADSINGKKSAEEIRANATELAKILEKAHKYFNDFN